MEHWSRVNVWSDEYRILQVLTIPNWLRTWLNELSRALKLSDRCLLGVNNRNLKTFDVDLNTSLRLKKLLDPARLLVTESGIATPADVKMMQEHDIHAFLVGESFMKQPRPDQAFSELFGTPQKI